MATQLSDEIRALIDYANATTENGDTRLGDCIRTLVEGYNGGNNIPSSPLVIPTGAISSRLASLLAYANEATGAEDTRIGDAIKTLCDGYGGGDKLVFYDKLTGDGDAYIDTGIVINGTTDVISMDAMCGVRNVVFFGARSSYTSILQLSQQNVIQKNIRVFIGSATASTLNTDGVHSKIVNMEMNLPSLTFTSGTQSGTLPRNTGIPNLSVWLFKSNNTYGTSTNGASTFSNFKVTRAGSVIIDLYPCKKNGEPGMWDVISEAFFGNANTSGTFTVSNDS